jgi:hypothetical protein
MPGHTAQRGWVVWKECILGTAMGLELTAHSVVRPERGKLFDITPIHDERLRQNGFMRFVPHIGAEEVFWEYEKTNGFICCLNRT